MADAPVASDRELRESEEEVLGIARGGALNIGGQLCSQVSFFLITLLLARTLGRTDVGVYAEGFAFLVLLGLLSLSGFRAGLTRFVAVHLAEGDRGAVRGTVRLGLGLTEHHQVVGVTHHPPKTARLLYPERIQRMQVDVGHQG